MTTETRQSDAIFDRNLTTIGRVLEPPPEPTTAQAVRWKRTGSVPLGGQRSRFRLRPMMSIAAVLAGAVGVAVFIWAGFGVTPSASAETIFEGFRRALDGPIWIDMDGVELETAQASGQLYLELGDDPEDTSDDVLYSELHVRLLPDSDRWVDVDAVAVMCQTPQDAWAYTFGNGIGGPTTENADGRLVPRLPEEFVRNGSWMDFVRQPLGQFGGIPLRMQLTHGDISVTYRFAAVQREYLSSLMEWLLAFSGEETAEEIVSTLERLVGDVEIDTSDPENWILTASGPFGPAPPTEPETVTFDYSARISPESGRVIAAETRNLSDPDSAYARDAAGRLSAQLYAVRNVDELVVRLTPMAKSVELDRSDPRLWTISATSVQIELEAALEMSIGLEVSLSLEFDPQARIVHRAEFTNVGLKGGQIRMQLGGPRIDPAMLDPGRWTR